MLSIVQTIAQELGVREAQVQAAVDLLDGGATVPFVARYRKEATDGLDDVALRALDTRLSYLRELQARREAIVSAIDEQGKLTPALRQALADATTKQELEDLYLPFKLKRRTRGEMAREAGIEPLADRLLADPTLVPLEEAKAFVVPLAEPVDGGDKRPDFSTVQAVLDGVRDILSERWAEQSALVQGLRAWLWDNGQLHSRLRSGKDEKQADVAKFRDYFDYQEPIAKVPSHRALAVFRGRAQEVLDLQLTLAAERVGPDHDLRQCQSVGRSPYRPVRGLASPGPRGRRPAGQMCQLDLARQAQSVDRARPVRAACAKRPRRRRSGSLPTTCATCCWQRRPGRGWCWDWTRASEPVSRWRWSTATASWWRPPPCIHTSRARTGMVRCMCCAS